MKLKIVVALMMLAGLGCQTTSEPEDPRAKWGENPMENPEFMAAWMEAMSVTEPHQELAEGVGTWDVEIRSFVAPGAEPESMTCVTDARMILGNRYLLQEFKGEYEGMPFEGMLILGYDNLAGEFVSVWWDNFSTWPLIARGTQNEKGETTMTGTMKDVMTPAGRPYKHVSWCEGPDLSRFLMYDTMPDGTEWVAMDMTYRRRR
jgi:hypothetical protein